MSGRRVVVFSSAAELGPALAHMVASRADKVSMLSKELPALPDLDCSHWLVGFCDDRLVPFDDGENTYGLHKVTESHSLLVLASAAAYIKITEFTVNLICRKYNN